MAQDQTPQAPQDAIERKRRHFARKNRYADEFRRAGRDKEANCLHDCHETETLAACSNCGSSWWVKYRCKTRVCPLCSFKVMKERSALLIGLCKNMSHPKLLTLTMPTWTGDPKEGIRFLRAMFMKLRRRGIFKKVVGGAYQIELKPKPTGWHIHIHVLFDGPYIPRQWIFTAWSEITDIKVPQVDIRAASDPKSQEYVCKYAAKSVGFDSDHSVIVAWYDATKGQRLFGTFGKWYSRKLADVCPELAPAKPPSCCPSCQAEKTVYLARDGPYIFGWDLWDTIKKTICPNDVVMRDDIQVRDVLDKPPKEKICNPQPEEQPNFFAVM